MSRKVSEEPVYVEDSPFMVPNGEYLCEFVGLRDLPLRETYNEEGKLMEPAASWQFRILEGKEKGKTLERVTSKRPTTGNACGRMYAGLMGIPYLETGTELNWRDYKGCRYRARAERYTRRDQKLGSRVASLTPVNSDKRSKNSLEEEKLFYTLPERGDKEHGPFPMDRTLYLARKLLERGESVKICPETEE